MPLNLPWCRKLFFRITSTKLTFLMFFSTVLESKPNSVFAKYVRNQLLMVNMHEKGCQNLWGYVRKGRFWWKTKTKKLKMLHVGVISAQKKTKSLKLGFLNRMLKNIFFHAYVRAITYESSISSADVFECFKSHF